MNITLEYYKVFYYVAKLGSITLAAEELTISQPAVSQAIKHLERELGTALFIRTSKGVHVTNAGEVLYSYVSRGYEAIVNGEKKILEMLDLQAGEICIGASDMTLRFYLLPYLQIFHEEFPKVKVSVTNAPTPETLRFLQDGRIDFGVVSTPITSTYDFQMKKVREIEDIFVGGSSFSHLKNKVLSYQDLEALPLICLEGNTSTRTYIDKYLKNHQVTLNPEFELATSDMIVQFALRNLGVASVVKDFALEKLEQKELFQLQFEHPIPGRHMCVVTNKKYSLSVAAKRLFEIMGVDII